MDRALLINTLTVILTFGLSACASATPTPAPRPTLDPTLPAGRGYAIFTGPTGRCSTCHSLSPDTVIVGPPLVGVATRAETRIPGVTAEDYLTESILDPESFKVPGFEDRHMDPTLAKTLTVDQVNDLVAFLLTLK